MATAKKAAAKKNRKRDVSSAPGLSATEALFVAQYLIDFNAGRAYMAAYPKCSKNAAYAAASRLLKKVTVQSAVAAGARKTVAKLELTRERINTETARIAFFDARKLFRDDGTPKDITELDDDTAAAIAGLEVIEEFDGRGKDRVLIGHVRKYRVADKNAALERGAKLLGMFEKDNAQRVDPILSLLKGMSRSSFPLAGAVTPGDDDA